MYTQEDRRWKDQRHLLSMVMAVGRAALEEFVAVKGSGYAGKKKHAR